MRRASRSCSMRIKMSPSRIGPFTLRTIARPPSINSALVKAQRQRAHTSTQLGGLSNVPHLRDTSLRSSLAQYADDACHLWFWLLRHTPALSTLVASEQRNWNVNAQQT
jgi:hypothetical protein